MTISQAERPILFFDGECNLCNSSLQFIIRHDKKKIFLFAPLQSPEGNDVIKNIQLKNNNVPDSVVLRYNGKYFIRSSAALYTFKLLGGWWSVLFMGMIIPSFVRDSIYDLIARRRYEWFGKRDECMVPTPDLLDRFLQK